MNTYNILPATLQHNHAICKLMAGPMKGKMHLSKNRLPDFLRGANIQNNNLNTYICEDIDKDKICGIYSLGEREVFIDGQPQTIQYASDLRVDPNYQGKGVFGKIQKFIYSSKELDLAHSIVISDNSKMLKIIDKLNASGPLYHYVGKFNNYFLPLPTLKQSSGNSSIDIRTATKKDILAMQDYFNRTAPKKQFYPNYDFSRLDDPYYFGIDIRDYFLAFKNGQLVGIVGIWDQQGICKTTVVGYQPFIKWARPLLNLMNRSGIRLPAIGKQLNNLYLHTVLVEGDDLDVFSALLEAVLKQERVQQYDNLIVGLSEFTPLNSVLKSYKQKYLMQANYYLICRDPEFENTYEGKDFYFEIGRC